MELRALKEGEIEQWFDHLSEVFPTPRDYFVKHWAHDPTSDYKGILSKCEVTELFTEALR